MGKRFPRAGDYVRFLGYKELADGMLPVFTAGDILRVAFRTRDYDAGCFVFACVSAWDYERFRKNEEGDGDELHGSEIELIKAGDLKKLEYPGKPLGSLLVGVSRATNDDFAKRIPVNRPEPFYPIAGGDEHHFRYVVRVRQGKRGAQQLHTPPST